MDLLVDEFSVQINSLKIRTEDEDHYLHHARTHDLASLCEESVTAENQILFY